MDRIILDAKAIITEELEKAGCRVQRLLHFGSRARGDFRPDSDWDFYAIIDRDIPFPEKRRIATSIRRRFVQAGFCGDIFIQSERVAREREGNTGYLTYYAVKEGVEI